MQTKKKILSQLDFATYIKVLSDQLEIQFINEVHGHD